MFIDAVITFNKVVNCLQSEPRDNPYYLTEYYSAEYWDKCKEFQINTENVLVMTSSEY